MKNEKVLNAAKRAYRNAYICFQYLNFVVLYEKFDFQEKEAAAASEHFIEYDEKDRSSAQLAFWKAELLEDGVDVKKYAESLNEAHIYRLSAQNGKTFLHTGLSAMCAIYIKKAAETFFAINFKALKDYFSFTGSDAEIYMDGFRECMHLLERGMDKDFLLGYIKSHIGWEILEE